MSLQTRAAVQSLPYCLPFLPHAAPNDVAEAGNLWYVDWAAVLTPASQESQESENDMGTETRSSDSGTHT